MLKQALVDKQTELIAMETACLRETDRQVELEDSIIAWQDKYDRLYESHKRVQKVNQNLEDKLLKLVDRNAGERAQLTSDVATLSVRLAQANYNIATLQREIERYKTDMSLAIQLLQCKPDSFVSQKVTSLPLEIQSKVSQYMRLETNSHSDSEGSISGVGVATAGSYRVLPASDSPPPLCPFPPTAMVYSMRGIDEENVASDAAINTTNDRMISPSIMAKYLQDELKASEIKHCDTCLCSNRDLTVLADTAQSYSIATQTVLQGDANNALCLRCNSNLNSPSRTNSPYIMKLVKSSDSVISETKSSMSDSNNDTDKLFAPVIGKKDDLMVNPILGHHRLCDRTPKLLEAASKCAAAELQIENEIMRPIAKLNVNGSQNNRSPMILRQPPAQQQTLPKQHQTQQILLGSTNKTATQPDVINSSQCSNKIKKYDASRNNCSNSDVEPQHQAQQHINQQHHLQQNQQQQQQQMRKRTSLTNDTATGSTNSLWSKTSSNTTNNNADGAKLFETFNRNLIKSIKAENPKVTGPRLCALRIQNGSSNILLDNIESELSPVVYTRRTRFLDEELDETKDIITSSGGPSTDPTATMPPTVTYTTVTTAAASASPSSANIGAVTSSLGDNKTDYEKYREVESSIGAVSGPTSAHIRKDMLTLSSMSISTKTNNSPPIGLNAVDGGGGSSGNEITKQFQQQRLDKLESDTTISSRNANKSCTQSSSISSEPDIQESALLRRQQLTRVAEWVQNNHLDNIPISSHSTTSSMDAASIDSGYKTKINNNCINDLLMSTTTTTAIAHIDQQQHRVIVSSLSDDNKLISGGDVDDFAQNMNNNNFIQTVIDKRFVDTVSNGNNSYDDDADANVAGIPNGDDKANAGQQNAQIDFAQMEYNVKQFLLKQNEWSIHSNTSKRNADSCMLIAPTTTPVATAAAAKTRAAATTNTNPHRTETNL